jgi:glycosyltransferase involved in cell wall biosynthesis
MERVLTARLSEQQAARKVVAKRLKVRVGWNYGARYNTHHPPPGVDLVKGPLTPLTRINGKLDSFALIEPAGYDLIHSFNAIPIFTRVPFFVTFEDYCPRTPDDRPIEWLERLLRKVLLSDRCLGIVAMSEYALRKFRHQHQHHSELPELLAKTRVIYPAVPAMAGKPKPAGDKLRLLFVGRDFFRKGGPAVLKAHRRLASLGIPVETTLVSSLRWSEKDYIGPPDPQRVTSVSSSVGESGVKHYTELSQAETMELMLKADFLLLPTLHDTFGYVSMEAMAFGTPAIATSTCAQNEIVEHGRSGYLLDFENNAETGDWLWLYHQDEPGYVEAYWQTVERLEWELTERLATAWEDRKNYEAMSAAAIQRITERFSLAAALPRLAPLYECGRALLKKKRSRGLVSSSQTAPD